MAEYSAKQLGLVKSALPNSILEVIATLNRAGFSAFIVGGGVRDALLGLSPKDFDAVTDARPHEIAEIFGKRCRIIGRRFQLAHVYSGRDLIEVATFRAPPKAGNATTQEGMLIRDNAWGDIFQDSERRDFSINALYYQPLKGIVHDFCGALEDIDSKTLRLLGKASKRIEEDPVRLLRALRFKAKLGFEFDAQLKRQFNDANWALLDQVSPHRLYDETQKIFSSGYLVDLLPILFEYGAMRHLLVYPPKKPSVFLQRVALNTDKRILEGKSINPAFFYAALLWDNYLHQLNQLRKKNTPFAEAQQIAASVVIERQRQKTAIPKFSERFITDIWLLQPRLANPKIKQIQSLHEDPKFRAGFDFLLLREESGEDANPLSESTRGMGAWWQWYQTLSETQKQAAIDKLHAQNGRSGNRRNAPNFAKQTLAEKAQLQKLSATLPQSPDHQKTAPPPLFVAQNVVAQTAQNAAQNKPSVNLIELENQALIDPLDLLDDRPLALWIHAETDLPEKRQRRPQASHAVKAIPKSTPIKPQKSPEKPNLPSQIKDLPADATQIDPHDFYQILLLNDADLPVIRSHKAC